MWNLHQSCPLRTVGVESGCRPWRLVLLLGGLMISPPAEVLGGPSADLHAAFVAERVDLVVKGKVVEIKGPVKGSMIARVHIDAVLKGKARASDVWFVFPETERHRPGSVVDRVEVKQYGLFFLK